MKFEEIDTQNLFLRGIKEYREYFLKAGTLTIICSLKFHKKEENKNKKIYKIENEIQKTLLEENNLSQLYEILPELGVIKINVV